MDAYNHYWSDCLIEELFRHGVRCFIYASGARSAPLALALARHPDIEPVFHFDERAGAFYALGHARATGIPAVWITTSGTAVANGFPAVVEASMDGVPLILLTADRPPELRDTGANQTIHQPACFGSYTRWNVDMPCPDPYIDPAYVLTTAGQAIHQAQGVNPGPVHINIAFREPLHHVPPAADLKAFRSKLGVWATNNQPYARSRSMRMAGIDSQTMARWSSYKNGVVVVGRLNREEDRRAVRKWVSQCPWPVLPDIASGLRLGAMPDNVISYVDQILLSPEKLPSPDFILHLGGPVVSKRLLNWTASLSADRAQVKSMPGRQDPFHRGGESITCAISAFVESMDTLSPSKELPIWQALNQGIAAILRDDGDIDRSLDEIYVAQAVSRLMTEESVLFLGNSMPIRDMDQYAFAGHTAVPVGANRGASGIDGTLASACGWCAGWQRPVVVVLGDLACLHDLNALALVARSAFPLIVVVINNDGGGIFSFLPLADQTDVFEQCFGTPHGYQFEGAARQFNLPYTCPPSREAFDETLCAAIKSGRSCLIEVRTGREENAKRHREVQDGLRSVWQEG